MNAEIQNNPAHYMHAGYDFEESDDESVYSDYSDYSTHDAPDPDTFAPVLTNIDGLDLGTEADLNEDQLFAEVNRYVKNHVCRPVSPEEIRRIIFYCRGVRFWILDEYNEMEHGYFLGQFEDWDDVDKEDAYVDAIIDCANAAMAQAGEHWLGDKYETKSTLSGKFMAITNVNTPRREVLWLVKKLIASPMP